MLTVNRKDRNGCETIFEVVRVEFNPNSACAANEEGYTPSCGRVLIEFSTPQHHASVGVEYIAGDQPPPPQRDTYFYDGLVFVMNSDGKTIAKYDLGGWPAPQPLPVHGYGIKGSSRM